MSKLEKIEKLLIEYRVDYSDRAYEAFFISLSEYLNAVLKYKVFNSNEREDLAQEVLIAVHKSLPTYHSERSFSAWFKSIIKYKIIDYIRKNKKVQLESFEDNISRDQDLENDLYLRSILKEIKNENSLNSKIFWDAKVLGQSIKELSHKYQLTAQNIKVKIFRYKKKIKEKDLENSLENRNEN